MKVPSLPSDAIPGAIVGNRARLRTVTQLDLSTFYSWRADLVRVNVLPWIRSTPSFAQFADRMTAHVRQSTSLVVEELATRQPCGLMIAFDMNLIDGWCCLLSYIAEDYRGKAIGSEASLLFFDYLFRNYRVRKVYMDIHASNPLDPSPGEQAGLLVKEGLFRKQSKVGDGAVDVLRFAIYREKWMTTREGFLRSVGVGPDPLLELNRLPARRA